MTELWMRSRMFIGKLEIASLTILRISAMPVAEEMYDAIFNDISVFANFSFFGRNWSSHNL